MTLEEEITHSFPAEIIRGILLNATVKSLLRCKSVCKDWYSLISDHHFIKTHYTLSSSTTNNINYQGHRLIYNIDEDRKLYICPLYDVLFDKPAMNVLRLKNPLQRPGAFSIVGSCNGLVCLCVKDDGYNNFFIHNPSTRISNGLPLRRIYSRSRNSWPYSCSLVYSFGYDESNDDYKIVEMSTSKEVNIYSLKNGKWKNIGDYSYGYTNDACGIFSNGALHWVSYSHSPRTKSIVSLDLAKETYGEVLQPEGGMNLSLGVLGECLCGLYYYYESHADLWVMKVYGVKDSWTKLASFPYLTHHWISKSPTPLFIANDGNMLFKYAMDLVIYESKDSSFEYFDRRWKVCIVVESLVSPFPPLVLADNNEY